MIKRNVSHEDFGNYKIYLKETDEFLGSGNLTLHGSCMDEAEIGYMLLPKYWGKGFGSEIVNSLVNRAKNTGIKKIIAIIDPENSVSRKILTKLGFISETIGDIDGLPGEKLYMEL